MRVLILANNDVGLYKFRKELIQELVKKYEVHISLPYGDFVPQLKELGCQYIETPVDRRGTNPITDFKLLVSYLKIIKRVKPQVVLTYTIKPNVYGGLACRMAKVPYLSNITGLGSAVENEGLIQKITLLLYRTAVKKASCLFFQNEENLQFFKDKGLFRGNCRLIPGSGVNLDYYQVLDYPPEDTIKFMFISRVMKEKGIDQYLEAAQFIKGKYPNTEFHILGFCEEAYEAKLKELHDRGIIRYHGMQNDVREFHKISHCTIHPSYYPEGMSNVLLESAACGRPNITTNRSGCREIVDDGVNGYLVENQNCKDLIEKIMMFIEMNPEAKKQMGLAGRKKIGKEFDRNIVIDAYLQELTKICI